MAEVDCTEPDHSAMPPPQISLPSPLRHNQFAIDDQQEAPERCVERSFAPLASVASGWEKPLEPGEERQERTTASTWSTSGRIRLSTNQFMRGEERQERTTASTWSTSGGIRLSTNQFMKAPYQPLKFELKKSEKGAQQSGRQGTGPPEDFSSLSRNPSAAERNSMARRRSRRGTTFLCMDLVGSWFSNLNDWLEVGDWMEVDLPFGQSLEPMRTEMYLKQGKA